MYSTTKNITSKKMMTTPRTVCNKYFRYPDSENTRKEEGGLRLAGKYKQSIKEKPLVSIITVVYNNEETLERCINSILEQTYDNIEYIVIDGGSSDSTLDIIKKYKDGIDYFISEKDGGIYDAINKGLSLSSGDIVGILNSDDEFTKSAIENVVKSFILNEEVDLVYGKSLYMTNNREIPHYYREFNEYMFWNIVCNHEAIFVKNYCYDRTGCYDENYKIAADMKWVQQLFLNDCKAFALDHIVLKHYAGGVSTDAVSESLEERYKLLLENFPFVNRDIIDILFKYYYYKNLIGSSEKAKIIKYKNNSPVFDRMLNFMNIEKTIFDKNIRGHELSVVNNKIKTLHVSYFSNGGAWNATKNLHLGLSKEDVDTKCYIKKFSNNIVSNCFVESSNNMNTLVRNLDNRPKENLTVFTWTVPYLNSEKIELFKTFDIINLHWVEGVLGTEAIAKASYLDKPLVFTVHDMNFMTGGCHSFHGCDKWQTDCMNCPQLIDDYNDHPAKVLAAKKKYFNFQNITVVALSNHAKRIIEKSIYKNCRIEVIPNSIETDVFIPTHKITAKKEFKLPQDKKVIFFLPSFNSLIKGMDELNKALEILKDKADKYHLLVAGSGSNDFKNEDFNITILGQINDNTKLALAYSAADITIVPSLEETFSNTTAESLSCGTPVVGFKVGGLPDMIKDGYNGYTVELGDVEGLANSITKTLNGEDLSENCRTYAEESLKQEVQAKRYKALYKDLLSKRIKRTEKEEDIPEVFPETASATVKLLNEVIFAKDTQIKKMQSNINSLKNNNSTLKNNNNTLKNNKWYIFGQLSRKRKIWEIFKIISIKIKIYNFLKRFLHIVK